MNIKTKMLVSLSVLPILIILFIGIAWIQQDNLSKSSNTVKKNYEISSLADIIHRKIKNEAIYLRNIVLTSDSTQIQRETELLQSESESVMQDIVILSSMSDDVSHQLLIDELKAAYQNFSDYKNEVLRYSLEGNQEAASSIIIEKSRNFHEDFFETLSDITKKVEMDTTNSLVDIPKQFQKNIITSSIVILLFVLLSIGFIYRNIWNVVNRIKGVSSVMSNVANGASDLTTRIETKSNDEIDEVANSFNHMAQSLLEQTEKEKDENWLKSSISDITTTLTGSQSIEELSSTFLSKAVPLLEASHAVFYIMEQDEADKTPILKLKASFAYKERKHLKNTFLLGESLIGQAALEKSPIILTNVPSDYVTIRSGLGESTPLTLYVLPVVFKGEVKAVIEFASFNAITHIQQAFIEQMTDSLGIILDSEMGRIRLATLLEESQLLTEELQAQSEELQSQQDELKSINEELEEQALALKKSEEKLQNQQEELEQSNEELKEKAESLEIQNHRTEMINKEMMQTRLELEEKARQLALSSRYKSEFLANMSHELRTPLNSLLILSNLLSSNVDGNLTEKQIEFAKTIHHSGSDLLELINDILDLAKIESGKMEVEPNAIYIKELKQYVEQTFKPVASERNLHFEILLRDGLPQMLYSDGRRVQQVLKNLLSNAFKFTSKGKVILEISVKDRYKDGQPAISFAIRDTGIGIAKDKQEHIFEAFKQADGTTSRKYGGTGLGLSISREIAEQLGGEIVVESEEGKGSTFTFYVGDYESVDIKELEAMKEVAASLESIDLTEKTESTVQEVEMIHVEIDDRVKKLLIVDDDLAQRNSLMELIGGMDFVITAVSTGAEAIELLKVNRFDCMVLDLGLSDTTGFDLLDDIQSSGLVHNIKIFIYTGRDLSSKEEMQLKKYAHTIIIKDQHSPQRLLDELESYMTEHDVREGRTEVFHKPVKDAIDLVGKNILLVDDDVRNVFAISNILELYGMNVTYAENGAEGLELLESQAGFDMVLMDIMMPVMDGYETIRRIRSNSQYANLPIVALTAKAMKEDRKKCLEVGASDYVAKPVDPDQLISLIRVWLYPEREG